MRNRQADEDYRILAEQFGLSPFAVSSIVGSFFGAIVSESRKLPFNNPRRIYTKEKFGEYETATNIPFIGRIGPVYSRYLSWRRNEARLQEQVNRNAYRQRVSRDEIEAIAEEIFAGGIPVFPEKKKTNKMYNRVWMVGKHGKRMARQVIPKENVQD